MKKSIPIFILLALFFSGVNAQRRGLISSQRQDLGGYFFLSAGPSYLYGDTKGPILEKSLLNVNNWSTSLGFNQRLPLNFGYSVNLMYGNYVGDDNNAKDPHGIPYSYSSNILELTVRAEYCVKFGQRFRFQAPSSVYAFVGIGCFTANVTHPDSAIINNNFSKVLNPGITNSSGVILPVGIGYKYEFRNRLTLGAEACIRYAISDYLDGYDPPSSSKFNDILANLSITIGYKIF